MVVCTLALLPLQLSQQSWAETHAGFVRQWRGLACIGACLAGGVAFNNLSLVTVTLSLNQIIRYRVRSNGSCSDKFKTC